MAKKVLCIELGVFTTKIVEMDYQAKKPKVYKCVEIDTPHEAVEDGYINMDMSGAICTSVRNALMHNKIKTRRVLFTVFSSKIINREVIIPGVKPSQIKTVVKANISEYFPIELEDYKIGSILLETIKEGENAGRHRVLVAAAENELITSYEKLAEEMGFELVDVDYSGNSLYQASKKMTSGDEAIMVLKAEEEGAVVSIMRNETLVLQRNIQYTVGSFDTLSERVELINSVVNSLLRVSDFYLSRNEGVKIARLYVTGELSREHDDVERLSELTMLYGTEFDIVKGVGIGRMAEGAPINLFTAAIGAGLSSIGFANEKELQRHETNYGAASALMAVLALVVVAAIAAASVVPYEMALTEQKDLKRQEQIYSQAEAVHNQYLGMVELYDMVEYGNLLTQHSNDGILDFLKELEQKMPSDVEMTEFASDDELCVMTMRVADKETAAGVIDMLRGFETLMNVTVENISEESLDDGTELSMDSGDTVCYFSVSCYYYQNVYEDPATAAQPAADTAAADADALE